MPFGNNRVKAMLTVKRLYKYTTCHLPTPHDDPNGTELLRWTEGDEQTQALITLTLSDEYLISVCDAETTKDTLKILSDTFERPTLINKIVMYSAVSSVDAITEDSNTLTIEYIKGRLLQEEQKHGIRDKATTVKSESSALVATKPNGEPYYDVCTYCKKPGHTELKCCTKNPDLRARHRAERTQRHKSRTGCCRIRSHH
eukprot:IDg20156t1